MAIEAVIKFLSPGIRRPAERHSLPQACQEPLSQSDRTLLAGGYSEDRLFDSTVAQHCETDAE